MLLACVRRYRRSHSSNEINRKMVNYQKGLYIFTGILAIATVLLAIFTFLLYNSNEKLTNITTDYYKYHSPDVSLINGYIAKLYVLRDNNSGTYFTVLGIASVYNSKLSTDTALIRQKNLGKSYTLLNNDTVSVEGSSFPIPIVPGYPPKDVPILVTYKNQKIMDTNAPVEIAIDEDAFNLEVLHPTSKIILYNLTSLNPANITYTMGKDKADVKMNDGSIYEIDVRYTEDKKTYQDWKLTFLRPYGISSIIISTNLSSS